MFQTTNQASIHTLAGGESHRKNQISEAFSLNDLMATKISWRFYGEKITKKQWDFLRFHWTFFYFSNVAGKSHEAKMFKNAVFWCGRMGKCVICPPVRLCENHHENHRSIIKMFLGHLQLYARLLEGSSWSKVDIAVYLCIYIYIYMYSHNDWYSTTLLF